VSIQVYIQRSSLVMSLYLATAPLPKRYGYVIHIYDATTHVLMGEMGGHSDHINFLGFAPDGFRLVSTSKDFTVRVWDAGMLTELVYLVLEEEMGMPRQAYFSPDGNSLVTASADGIVHVWNLHTRTVILTVADENLRFHRAVFCQDSMSIVVSASFYGMDGHEYMLKVVAVPSGDVLLESSSPETFANAMACVPGHDKLLAIANDCGDVVLLDRVTGSICKSFKHNSILNVKVLCFSGDGAVMASFESNRIVTVWDVSSGNQLQRFECDGIYKLSLNLAGNRLCCSCSGAVVRIFEVATRQTLHTISGMNHGCYSDNVTILM
jgi:WD40 repeat protein